MATAAMGRNAAAGGGFARALAVGLAGSGTVTLLNELGRRTLRDAPRADVLGKRGVRAVARRLGKRPGERETYLLALAGEVVSNTLYYAIAAGARRPLLAGALLGAAAGAGAVVLPERLGLGRRPTRRTRETAVLSAGWYLAAGLASGIAARWLRASALARPR
jgi:hypothetical protein